MKNVKMLEGKNIQNKDTQEVRKVVRIDEESKKLFTVPVENLEAEPKAMAYASYTRRWSVVEEETAEAVAEVVETTATEETVEVETPAVEEPPMQMSDVVTKLENLFDLLNKAYFENELPKPVITVQSSPKAYGHCTTKKVWKSENDSRYEINIGAEFLNRALDDTAATMCHEMVHLYCLENEIADTCQHGRYHNKTFKTECENRDLAVDYDRANGYTHTSATDAFKETLKNAGFVLEVPFARIPPKEKAKAQREKAHAYVCPVCGQTVKTTADLNLVCGNCDVQMTRVG